MLSLRRIFVIALTAASVAVADYTTVLNDLKILDGDTKNLTTATNAYTGTNDQTARLSNLFQKLRNDLNLTQSDTQSSTVPTAAQAQTVLNYINGTLFTDTKAANTATKNKRATFTQAGLKGVVKSAQMTIKSAVDSLADALIAKAPTAALKSQGTTIKSNYDAVFQDTINYFS